jgi:hypothetical protein
VGDDDTYTSIRCPPDVPAFAAERVGALNGLHSFLAAAGLGEDPRSALTRWAPGAGPLYFQLLLRGLERRGIDLGRRSPRNGAVARSRCKREVSANPRERARTPANPCHAEGRGFESLHPLLKPP